MDLSAVTEADVDFQPFRVAATLKLGNRKLACPDCEFTTKARYDLRPVTSRWRHLDLGRWRLEVTADLRRLECPTHEVRTEGGPAFDKSARKPRHAAKAIICYDPFHVVGLATSALEKIRRQVWQDLRRLPDQDAARRFKGARWALLKNPCDLTDDQAATLRKLKRKGGELWRAYALKEALRAVFAGDLSEDEVGMLRDRFCSKASRSGLKPFVTAAQTIRKHRDGILAAVRLGINNARNERLNRRVRLIVNRAYGFHSAKCRPRPHHDHPGAYRTRPPPRTPASHRSLKITHIHAGRPTNHKSVTWGACVSS